MNRCDGFSLTEVLISLMLLTTTVLALSKQQWQVAQWFNQTHALIVHQAELDNSSESLM